MSACTDVWPCGDVADDECARKEYARGLSTVPSASREVYHSTGMGRPRVVLTIHNMDNSGECRQDEFAFAGTAPF